MNDRVYERERNVERLGNEGVKNVIRLENGRVRETVFAEVCVNDYGNGRIREWLCLRWHRLM